MEVSADKNANTVENASSQPNSQESSPSQRRIFKIIVLGDSNVGKTCLSFRFCGEKFPEKPEATIGVDFRDKDIEIDGESIKLQLWDTAGQERFRKSMVQHYYRNVHAVIFVYDVTKLSSFENLPTWVDECDRHALSTDLPRILAGNKCDMHERKVITTSAGQKFAEANHMPFYETSAKMDEEGQTVNKIFMSVAKRLKMQRPFVPASVGRSFGGTSGSARSSARRHRVIRVKADPSQASQEGPVKRNCPSCVS